jgi:hypothetical protein
LAKQPKKLVRASEADSELEIRKLNPAETNVSAMTEAVPFLVAITGGDEASKRGFLVRMRSLWRAIIPASPSALRAGGDRPQRSDPPGALGLPFTLR